MWLGEQITERGIGNGISLIIFAGIVVRLPSAIANTFRLLSTGEMNIFAVLLLVCLDVGGHRIYHFCGTGSAANSGSVRQTDGGTTDVWRQSTHLPLKDQHIGCYSADFCFIDYSFSGNSGQLH